MRVVYVAIATAVTACADPCTVARFGRFEAAVVLEHPPTNPFALNTSTASAVFTHTASGVTATVIPFYFQNFSRHQASNGTEVLHPLGEPHFVLRFSPEKLGNYSFRLHGCRAMAGNSSGGDFISVDAGRKGFVRVAQPHGQYFTSGVAEFLLGENMAFPGPDPILRADYNYTQRYPYAGQRTYMYDHYLSKMASAGGNYGVWLGLGLG